MLNAEDTLEALKKQEQEKAKTITPGTTYETNHWEITLVNATLTSKILPNNLSGYYHYYYQTDGGIYADLKFTIKNTGVSIRSIESVLDSYGTEIVEGLIGYARSRRANAVTIRIAQENEASNALARKVGALIIASGSYTKGGTNEEIPDYLYELKL